MVTEKVKVNESDNTPEVGQVIIDGETQDPVILKVETATLQLIEEEAQTK